MVCWWYDVCLVLMLFQYEGNDEDVDVEEINSEMLDIDLNGEVEIKQFEQNVIGCMYQFWQPPFFVWYLLPFMYP